jgi:hypothetical protein
MPAKHCTLLSLLLSGLLLLGACRSDAPLPTAIPFESEGSGAVNPPPPTPEVTATSAPTLAPVVTLAAPATPTPMPTPTRVPVVLRSAEDFGQDRNPLTGERVEDPGVLDRRPLAVKISNAPARWVRPQSGLNDADLVFEHITESGITRFTMIIYGKTPAEVGPIRSARLIDLELPAMYDGALVYSGSSEGVRQHLLNTDFRPRIIWPYEPGYYRTGANKPLEHTFYGDPELFWQVLEGRNLNRRPDLSPAMTFDETPPAGGQPAGRVAIDYRAWEEVAWQYDADKGRYLRWADGAVHSDANYDEQVAAANVVVVFAGHVNDTTICEQVYDNVCTAFSVRILLEGSGPAVLFRDGQSYEGTWRRTGRYDMLTLYDAEGQPLPLQIGNTWFEVIPTWYSDPLEVSP